MQLLAAASGGTSPRPSATSHRLPPRHRSATDDRHVSAADLGPSWHPGCHLSRGHLRRVEVNYIGFDGRPTAATWSCMKIWGASGRRDLRSTLQLGYPIEKIRTADLSGADDDLTQLGRFQLPRHSGTGRWSQHAFVSDRSQPLINPSIDRRVPSNPRMPRHTRPQPHRPRSPARGRCRRARFTDRGWRWGGDWRAPLDYQHFER